MADDGENADPPSDDEEFRNFMNSVDMIDMREENFYSSGEFFRYVIKRKS